MAQHRTGEMGNNAQPDPQAGPATVAVHGGQRERGAAGFPSPHLILNSAVLLDSVEQGWEMLTNESTENIAYQRYANPTVRVLEDKFARMEGARYALAVNTGMTACFLLFRALLRTGDHLVTCHSLYHEISDQMVYDRESCGVDCSFVSDYTVDGFRNEFRPNTRLVFIESPTNPSMFDVDIPALAEFCQSRGAVLVVDNTLLTHEYQKPLRLGAAVALYSTTKVLNGHGDVMGALITVNDAELYQRLKFLRENAGLVLDPFSAWLTIRGLRTLPLRLQRHTENALRIIEFLQANYPQLPIRYPLWCPNSATNQVSGGGGVVSIVLPSKAQGTQLMRSLSLFKIGTTFGNLESLVYHFGTFARPSRDITKIGIPLGLIRLSVGIEDARDIIADLAQAMKTVMG